MYRKLFFGIILQILIWGTIAPVFAAGGATFFLSGVGKPVEVGQSFSVTVSINPSGTSIDTARAHLSFDNTLISATSANLSGNLTSPSPGNTINNSTGNISWGGFTVENPASSTSPFLRIAFKANAVGTANIRLLGSSKLISDGEEVGNPGGFNSISVQIVPSTASPSAILQLTSPTHPDQEKWYQANIAQFKWADVGGRKYLWGFNQDPDTLPSQTTTDRSKQIKGIKNGIWYFHLSTESAIKENAVEHYRVKIDTLKPNPIEPYLDISDSANLTLKFATTDYHSGVASYDLRINNVDNPNVVSPFVLHGLNLGTNLVTVTAYDQAGNSRVGWIKFVLEGDGTIRDITTSGAGFDVCATVPFLCTNNVWLLGFGLLLVILILIFFRRRPNVMKVKTVTHTDVGTIAKITTKTDPKTGKKLVTKVVTKTDTKNITETDAGEITQDKLEEVKDNEDERDHKKK